MSTKSALSKDGAVRLNVSSLKCQVGDQVSHKNRQIARRFCSSPARPRSVRFCRSAASGARLISQCFETYTRRSSVCSGVLGGRK